MSQEEHVTHGSDLRQHVLSAECWCLPTVEVVDAGGSMVSRRVVHNVSPGLPEQDNDGAAPSDGVNPF